MNLHKLFGKDADKIVALCIKMYNCNTDIFANFSQICGIAKFHHVRVDWCGNDPVATQPDKWIIYRNGIRYFVNIDAIRYDGIYARLKKL